MAWEISFLCLFLVNIISFTIFSIKYKAFPSRIYWIHKDEDSTYYYIWFSVIIGTATVGTFVAICSIAQKLIGGDNFIDQIISVLGNKTYDIVFYGTLGIQAVQLIYSFMAAIGYLFKATIVEGIARLIEFFRK